MKTQSVIVNQEVEQNQENTFWEVCSKMFKKAKGIAQILNKELEVYGTAAAAAIRN